MQCNAYSPKIDIWTDARYGAYRWYKIENLNLRAYTKNKKKRKRKKTTVSLVAQFGIGPHKSILSALVKFFVIQTIYFTSVNLWMLGSVS